MPRNESGVYSLPAGTDAVTQTPVSSAKYNSAMRDLRDDANIPRPINAGGTGASTAAAARAALGVPSTADVVPATRKIAAGDGLTGGGTLAADRTIALGTPSTITANSVNSVTATSHTHALPEGEVRSIISAGAAGVIGTYALLRYTGPATVNPGDLIAGTELRFSNVDGSLGPSVNGTWRCMGYAHTASDATRTTLWLKTA